MNENKFLILRTKGFDTRLKEICKSNPRICKRFKFVKDTLESLGYIPNNFNPKKLTNSEYYELDLLPRNGNMRLLYVPITGGIKCLYVGTHDDIEYFSSIFRGNKTKAAHYDDERLPLATGAVYGAGGAAVGGLLGGLGGAAVGALSGAVPAAALTHFSKPTIEKMRDSRLLFNYASNPDITQEDIAKGQAMYGAMMSGATGAIGGAILGARDHKMGVRRGAALGLPMAVAGGAVGYLNGKYVSGPLHEKLRLMGFRQPEAKQLQKTDFKDLPYAVLSNEIKAKTQNIETKYPEPADKDKSSFWGRTKSQVALPTLYGTMSGALMGLATGKSYGADKSKALARGMANKGFFARRVAGAVSGGKWGLIRGVGSGLLGAGISEALAPTLAGARTIKENWRKDPNERKKFYVSDKDRHNATMIGHTLSGARYGYKDFKEAKSLAGKAAALGFTGLELATYPKGLADEIAENSYKRKYNVYSSDEMNRLAAALITPTTKDITVVIKNPSGTRMSQFDIETALLQATVDGATAKLVGKPVYNPDRTVTLYIRLSRPSKAQEYLQSFTNLTGVTILTVGITAGLSKLKYFKP